jgi:chromate transporter
MDAAENSTRPRPASLGELFSAFTRLALQGFGGVLAVAQVELVERRRWLTKAEFLEMFSAAQVLPGPNIVNLAVMMGDRWFGWRGAVAATAGLLLAPSAIVLGLTLAYRHWQHLPMVAGALRGMAAVAAGLILSTAFKLAPALRTSVMGPAVCVALGAAAFLAVAVARWPLPWVVLGIGSLGGVWAYRCLGKRHG